MKKASFQVDVAWAINDNLAVNKLLTVREFSSLFHRFPPDLFKHAQICHSLNFNFQVSNKTLENLVAIRCFWYVSHTALQTLSEVEQGLCMLFIGYGNFAAEIPAYDLLFPQCDYWYGGPNQGFMPRLGCVMIVRQLTY